MLKFCRLTLFAIMLTIKFGALKLRQIIFNLSEFFRILVCY